MDPIIYYIMLGVGIIGLLVQLIPWGTVNQKKKHHAKQT
jgi:membrane-bound ClpP family serine protease